MDKGKVPGGRSNGTGGEIRVMRKRYGLRGYANRTCEEERWKRYKAAVSEEKEGCRKSSRCPVGESRKTIFWVHPTQSEKVSGRPSKSSSSITTSRADKTVSFSANISESDICHICKNPCKTCLVPKDTGVVSKASAENTGGNKINQTAYVRGSDSDASCSKQCPKGILLKKSESFICNICKNACKACLISKDSGEISKALARNTGSNKVTSTTKVSYSNISCPKQCPNIPFSPKERSKSAADIRKAGSNLSFSSDRREASKPQSKSIQIEKNLPLRSKESNSNRSVIKSDYGYFSEFHKNCFPPDVSATSLQKSKSAKKPGDVSHVSDRSRPLSERGQAGGYSNTRDRNRPTSGRGQVSGYSNTRDRISPTPGRGQVSGYSDNRDRNRPTSGRGKAKHLGNASDRKIPVSGSARSKIYSGRNGIRTKINDISDSDFDHFSDYHKKCLPSDFSNTNVRKFDQTSDSRKNPISSEKGGFRKGKSKTYNIASSWKNHGFKSQVSKGKVDFLSKEKKKEQEERKWILQKNERKPIESKKYKKELDIKSDQIKKGATIERDGNDIIVSIRISMKSDRHNAAGSSTDVCIPIGSSARSKGSNPLVYPVRSTSIKKSKTNNENASNDKGKTTEPFSKNLSRKSLKKKAGTQNLAEPVEKDKLASLSSLGKRPLKGQKRALKDNSQTSSLGEGGRSSRKPSTTKSKDEGKHISEKSGPKLSVTEKKRGPRSQDEENRSAISSQGKKSLSDSHSSALRIDSVAKEKREHKITPEKSQSAENAYSINSSGEKFFRKGSTDTLEHRSLVSGKTDSDSTVGKQQGEETRTFDSLQRGKSTREDKPDVRISDDTDSVDKKTQKSKDSREIKPLNKNASSPHDSEESIFTLEEPQKEEKKHDKKIEKESRARLINARDLEDPKNKNTKEEEGEQEEGSKAAKRGFFDFMLKCFRKEK
ncbi:Protein of unknown function, partial [Gryllus bimaculatus]